jgi:amidase
MLWSAIAATAHAWLEEEKGSTSKASDFEPATWGMIKSAHILSAWDVAKAVAAEGELARIMTGFFTQYDLLLTPTVARPPVKIGELKPNAIDEAIFLAVVASGNSTLVRNTIRQLAQKSFQWTAFCAPFNMTGQPAVSVPLYWTADNLPIGTQLVARYGEEDTLFRIAGQLERAQPWFQRRPPLWAGNTN